jgi:hypothetical protein
MGTQKQIRDHNDRERVEAMKNGKRKLVLNWCPAHEDLKRSVEDCSDPDKSEIGNDKGWTYLTFFPEGTNAKEALYDIDVLQTMALENRYYLPHEVVTQHNKVVLTAFSDSKPPISPLLGIFTLVAMFVNLFDDTNCYPFHGIYGKFGGIYERQEKGRVLAVYSRSTDALLTIYASLEKLISEAVLKGFRFELDFSNGLSAIPRLLQGFNNPEYRQAGVQHYRIADPTRFTMLLDQARKDYKMYRFYDAATTSINN